MNIVKPVKECVEHVLTVLVTFLAPQVYKATLKSTGESVAIKVQRPGVLETVSLDLHLARELGYLLNKVACLLSPRC